MDYFTKSLIKNFIQNNKKEGVNFLVINLNESMESESFITEIKSPKYQLIITNDYTFHIQKNNQQ